MIADPCCLHPRDLQSLKTRASSSAKEKPRQRFTLDGGDALEKHLADTCDKIRAGIQGLIPPKRLQAILLGGGYGRGEGGVLLTDEGENAYNDLEFYVFLRGNRHLNERRYGHALEVLGQILTPLAGVEVEFKISSLPEFNSSAISMFSYDLSLGHRWLLGDERLLLKAGHHKNASDIPLSEATRLLMNRCTGLLFAKERLERSEFTASDADFVQRNLAKAELAFGDAVLCACGRYHWSCQERHRLLETLKPDEAFPFLPELRQHHALGLEFKLHPFRSRDDRSTLQAQHERLVSLGRNLWLWIESRRLKTDFISMQQYLQTALDLCPETSAPRNLLVNLKVGGLRRLLNKGCFRHPRAQVLRALCQQLWGDDPSGPILNSLADPEGKRPASTAAHAQDLIAYRNLWQKVN